MARGGNGGVKPGDTPAGIDPDATDDTDDTRSAADELTESDVSALKAILATVRADELAAALRHVKQTPEEGTTRGRGCYVYRLRRGVRQLRLQVAHRDGSKPTKIQLVEGKEYPLPCDPEQICRPPGKMKHFPQTVVYIWQDGREPIALKEISVETVNIHRRDVRAPKLAYIQARIREELGKDRADQLFHTEGWDGMVRYYDQIRQAKKGWKEMDPGELNPPLPEAVTDAPERIESDRQEAQTFQGEIVLDGEQYKALMRRAKRDQKEAEERRAKERERRMGTPGSRPVEATL